MKANQNVFGISQQEAGRYTLVGELSFTSVLAALKQSAVLFALPADKMVFDLAGITKADSAGLALLLEWLRLAGQAGVDLHYVNLPSQLSAMAHVVGVDEILVID